MRILLINHYAGSPKMGMEFRPYYLARHWQHAGHKVLIAAAGQSHLRQHNPELMRRYTKRRVEGVDYLFVSAPPYSGNGVDRLANVGAFLSGLGTASEPLAERFQPDVVLSSSTYPFDAYIARRIADRSGGIHIHEIHDLWPLTLIKLHGLSPMHPGMVAMQMAEDFALGRSDAVVSMLPGVGDYLDERGFLRDKFTCIPNGVEPDEAVLPPPPGIVDAFWQMRQRYRHIVLYLGGFARANGVDDYLKLAALRPDVLFVAVGDGAEKEHLVRRAADERIFNVLFLPPVTHDRVYATLCLADVLYIGAKRSELYRYGVGMNKFYEYMASGRPVISAIEAGNDPVGEAGCGASVPAQSPAAAAAALDDLLLLSDAERSAVGQRGIDYVARNHTYPVLAERYIKLMEDTLDGKSLFL